MELDRLRSTPDHAGVDVGDGWRPLAGSGVMVDLLRDGDGISVTVGAPGVELRAVRLRWRLRAPDGLRILGDAWERGYGDLEWRGIVPERVLPWYALMHGDGALHAVGVMTGAASFAAWQVDQAGLTVTLDLRNGGAGTRLGARRLVAARLRWRVGARGEDEFAAAHAFCCALCPQRRLPDVPIYGANDWYYAYGEISDATVRRDAATLADLTAGLANRPYAVIDAGWNGTHCCPGGPWTANAKFGDLRELTRAMAAMGVHPGAWMRPLLHDRATIDASLALATPREHLADEIVLDPSRPDVLAIVRAGVRSVVAAGFRLVKHDFTTFDVCGLWGRVMGRRPTLDGWRFADDTRTTAEIIVGLYAAIREGAGDAVVLGCNTVGHLAAGLFEVSRTGDDTSGRVWDRTRRMGPNTLAMRMPQHGAFHLADADCVGVTTRVPWSLNRQWLDVVARSGTALFCSLEPAALTDAVRADLKRAYAIASVARVPSRPLDWRETTQPQRWAHADGESSYAWAEETGADPTCP